MWAPPSPTLLIPFTMEWNIFWRNILIFQYFWNFYNTYYIQGSAVWLRGLRRHLFSRTIFTGCCMRFESGCCQNLSFMYLSFYVITTICIEWVVHKNIFHQISIILQKINPEFKFWPLIGLIQIFDWFCFSCFSFLKNDH